MTKHFRESIAQGLMDSYDPQVIATAKRFMQDNGFNLNLQGKGVACSEVEQWAVREGVAVRLRVAIQNAIMQL